MAVTNRPQVGVGVFIWKDDKFLMGQRVGSHGSGTWAVPGGHLEFGESWEECAKREVMEETGLVIKDAHLVAVTNDIFKNERKHSITLWIYADWQSGEPSIQEPDKFVDQRWCTFKTLPAPLFEPCWANLRAAKPEFFI
jgi:8-oxo-dGTP diphosphatase